MTTRDSIAFVLGAVASLCIAVVATIALADELPPVDSAPPAGAALANEIPDLRFVALELLMPSAPHVFYQYVDEAGRVRFAESVHDVPEAWRERAGRVRLDVIPPETPAAARVARKLLSQRDANALD